MAKTQTYSMEKILAAQEALRQLPVKEMEKSKTEVVVFLKADLRKAVKQGHSLKDIQAILAEQGIEVPLARMEAVLRQPGKESARKKTGKPKAACVFPMEQETHEVSKNEPIQSGNLKISQARMTETRNMPSYYTPDRPDAEL